MKRFALLFFMGWLAIHAFRGGRHHHPAPPPPPHAASQDLRVMVIQDDEGRPVTIVEHANDPEGRPTPTWPHDDFIAKNRRDFAATTSVTTTSTDPDDDDCDAFAPPAPPAPPNRPIRGLERLEAKLGQLDRKVRDTLSKAGLEKLGKIQVVMGSEDDEEPDKPAPASVLAKAEAAETGRREVVTGRISADEDRARKDAKLLLERRVAEWLEPVVPRTWSRLPRESSRLIQDIKIAPVTKDYGTMYKATIEADFSRDNRTRIVRQYEREQVGGRLLKLGGALGFALACLASVVGYIRADEATKGYYTNSLRLVTVVGLGAAGMAIYRSLA